MKRPLLAAIERLVERRRRAPADHLRRLGEASFPGFVKLLLFLPLASHGGGTRAEVVHAARLVGAQHEDCSSCLRMAVNLAMDDGMDGELVEAILRRDGMRMDRDVHLVVRFADGVLARDGSEAGARADIEERLGARALADVSLALGSARVFPTVKRGLGLAAACEPLSPRIASR
jgi:hypothetical protein